MAVDYASDIELVSVTVPGQTEVVTISVPGIQGPPGKFKVGTVSTGAPGTSAAVTTVENAQGEQVVSFTIPRGDVGANVARTPVASTVNTAGTFANQWARVAQVRITSQYHDASVELKMLSNGSGSGTPSAADIIWRVKQQNALGGVPVGSLVINNPLGVVNAADFAAVTETNSATETVVGLYVRVRSSFESVYFYERVVVSTNSNVTFYLSASFVGTTLPAGAGTNFSGAENPTDIKLGTTSTTAAAGDHTHAGLSADAVATTASIRTLGTGAQQAAAGNHTHTGLTADAAATTASIRTLGTGAQQAAAGNHTHSYAATTHTHAIADLTATGTRDATTFLRGDGTWSTTPAAQGAADATTTTKGLIQLAGDLGGTATAPTVPGLANKVNINDSRLTDARTPTAHTHPASQISDSTATGRSLIVATDAAAARTAIGAGTGNSNLALGTTNTTAAAGDHTHTAASIGAAPATHTHTAANISDATATGRSVLMAADAAAARTAIGAGTGNSNLALGTTNTTAAAGDHTHTAAQVGALAAGTGVVRVESLTQAAYDALGTKVATTLYVIVG